MILNDTQIPCGGCNQMVMVKLPPQPKIVNMDTVSLLILEHTEQTMCPNCNCPVAPTIAGANLALIAVPVPAQKQNLIVMPGGISN